MQRQRRPTSSPSQAAMVVPHPARDVPRDPARRLRFAGAAGGAGRDSLAAAAGGERGDAGARHSPRGSSSTTWPRTCTRGTLPSPSDGRRRSPLIASCSPSCSGPMSCASSSTRTAISSLELELQWLAEGRQARTTDAVHDLLRRVGDLDPGEVAARAVADLDAGRAAGARGIAPRRPHAHHRRGAMGRDRGCRALPRRTGGQPTTWHPETRLAPRTRRWRAAPAVGADPRAVHGGSARCAVGPVAHGGGRGTGAARRRWAPPRGCVPARCLRPRVRRPRRRARLRRRSLARLRREIEPVPAEALARFLPAWQGIGSLAGGLDRLLEVVTQLEGAPMPASILERDVLRARVRDYAPACSTSSVPPARWCGSGAAR